MKEGHSRSEEQYFARVDADLMKEYRSTREMERSKLERASHFMKCPGCGGNMTEVAHHGVTVEQCVDCNGVWLDAGDLEQLEHENTLTRFFGAMFGRHP